MIRFIIDSARHIEDVAGFFQERDVGKSLIFIEFENNVYMDATAVFNCIRNRPDFSDTHLTALNRGQENGRLMDIYPDRRYFLYELDFKRRQRGEQMRWEEIFRENYPD